MDVRSQPTRLSIRPTLMNLSNDSRFVSRLPMLFRTRSATYDKIPL